MVAKSYQQCKLISKPFLENGKEYVLIDFHNREKKVRWYPEENKKLGTLADTLGFKKGYIWVFKGYTNSLLDWFKFCTQTRYHVIFGWYIVSTDEVPQLPAGVEAIQLPKEKVFADDDHLLPQEIIKATLNKLLYEEKPSTHQGVVGDKITTIATLEKITDLGTGIYGQQVFYLFHDEEDNAYCWFTAPKKFTLGSRYEIKGKVKKFQVYKGEEQTVLTNCRTKEIRE